MWCPPEAGEILRALGSGRQHGSLLTMGATSAETALWQLATWSMVDGFSWENASRGIASGIRLVVRVTRGPRGFAAWPRSLTSRRRMAAGRSGQHETSDCTLRKNDRYRNMW